MSSIERRVLIIDTSILCVWLRVDGFESCGPNDDRWDYERVKSKIEEEVDKGTKLILPLAAIIETGNHITHIKRGNKRDSANALKDIIFQSADNQHPWVEFSAQTTLWTADKLKQLAERWINNIDVLTIADASIVDVAEYFSKFNDVEILTGDAGLKAYEPIQKREVPVPRRKR